MNQIGTKTAQLLSLGGRLRDAGGKETLAIQDRVFSGQYRFILTINVTTSHGERTINHSFKTASQNVARICYCLEYDSFIAFS